MSKKSIIALIAIIVLVLFAVFFIWNNMFLSWE